MSACRSCGKRLQARDEGRGRPREFCDATCRSAARRDRERKRLAKIPDCRWPSGCWAKATKMLRLGRDGEVLLCEQHLQDAWRLMRALDIDNGRAIPLGVEWDPKRAVAGAGTETID